MFTSASLLLTEQCNLACRYCFERGKCKTVSMNSEVAFRALRFLFENAVKDGAKQVQVMLFGGEPLLNFQLCDYILRTGLELSARYGIRFVPQLITNATVMSDRIELMLRRYAVRLPGFTCQLSVDGCPQAHDAYRVYEDGRGSFERVAKNVPVFGEIFGRRLSIHGCVNKRTLPLLAESYRYIAETWNPGSIWFMPVHTENWGESDVRLYDEQLEKIFGLMTRRGTVSGFSPIDKLLSGCSTHPEKPCGAGVSFCTVNGKGEIFPCHNIYFNDDARATLLGDVYRGITHPERLEVYRNYTVADLGCGGCENVRCYRCIADNFAVNGDITAQVGRPVRCEMSRVEHKWQTAAVEYARSHAAPAEQASQLDRIEAGLGRLTDVLYRGLGGEGVGA